MNIFISYNRKNSDMVNPLAKDIEAIGHTVWFDQELSGGQAWWDKILATIRDCDVFIFMLAPEALNSTACSLEYSYAFDLGKSILPVLVTDGVSTNLLPPALSQVQFVDYQKPDRDAALRLARAFTTIPTPEPLPDPLPAPPKAPVSYLGSLAEKIDTASNLSYEEQSALVVDLKRGLRNHGATDDTWTLFKKLRKRRDLFAAIAEEIDDLIKNTSKDSSSISQSQNGKTSLKMSKKNRSSWSKWVASAITLLVFFAMGYGVGIFIKEGLNIYNDGIMLGGGVVTWAIGLVVTVRVWRRLR